MSGNLKRRTAQWAAIMCCLLVVGLMSATALAGQGYVAYDGINYEGRIVIVIGKPASGSLSCNFDPADLVNAVIINPANGPAVLRQVAIVGGVEPGNRFQITGQGRCQTNSSLDIVTLSPVSTANAGVTVFETADVLDGESTGVVTGAQDECGVAEVIFVKKGGPPVRSELAAFDMLEPGDRIVDIVNLGPSGGGTLYAASVEY